MRVGTVIQLVKAVFNNPIGKLGVVYEEYNAGYVTGVSIIFENGDLARLAKLEQDLCLLIVGFDKALSTYNYVDVPCLVNDFRNGIFDTVLKEQIFKPPLK